VAGRVDSDKRGGKKLGIRGIKGGVGNRKKKEGVTLLEKD